MQTTNSLKRWAVLLLCAALLVPASLNAEPATPPVQAQQQSKASGTVKDETGAPIIGASVFEKGTRNGTITDFDGRFELTVTPGATLVVSNIGFIDVEVAAGSDLNVTLSEDKELLEEVVVVGYGTVKRKDLTGSISAEFNLTVQQHYQV